MGSIVKMIVSVELKEKGDGEELWHTNLGMHLLGGQRAIVDNLREIAHYPPRGPGRETYISGSSSASFVNAR